MKVIDEECLDQFRGAKCCEYCGFANWYGPLDPHHWKPKGMGSGSRLDIPCNLIALCRVCHNKAEAGNIPRHVILALIAVREKKWPDEIEAEIHLLLRTPKEMP